MVPDSRYPLISIIVNIKELKQKTVVGIAYPFTFCNLSKEKPAISLKHTVCFTFFTGTENYFSIFLKQVTCVPILS